MLRQVSSIFARVANHDANADGIGAPVMRIRMSSLLYNLHMNLYRDSHVMLDQQERVLNDGEHQQVIIDGMRRNLRMPRTELFRLRVSALKAHLNSYNPRDGMKRRKDMVEVPLHVARAMHATMLLSTQYVFDYFTEMKQSDYMKCLRQLKKEGVPYAGPGSFQEVFSTYLTLHYLAAQLEAEALPPRLSPNWTRQSGSPDNSRNIPDPGAHIDVKAIITPPIPKAK